MASYYDQLKVLAKSIGSDGCTGVSDIYIECCWEHDYTYVTGMTPQGRVVDKKYADLRFKNCYQIRMALRWFSPISWIRYLGVVKLGRGIWNKSLVEPSMLLFIDRDLLKEAKQARLRIIQEGY